MRSDTPPKAGATEFSARPSSAVSDHGMMGRETSAVLLKIRGRRSGSVPNASVLVSRQLGMNLSLQEMSQWCWAACAVMVLQHFGRTKMQCQLAEWLFGPQGCCANPTPPRCNKPCGVGDVGAIYQAEGLQYLQATHRVTSAQIRSEIDSNSPVQIGYHGQRLGHLVLVGGYVQEGADLLLTVIDPQAGIGTIRFSRLVQSQQYGIWQYTWIGIRR